MSDAHDQELSRAVARWGLVLEGPPLRSPTGCVAFARRGTDDGQVVVKIADPGSDEARGASVLRHFGGRASVIVLDAVDGVALLERARPGRPLTQLVLAGRDDEATGHLCAVMAALHGAEPSAVLPSKLPAVESAGGFPRVEDWGTALAQYQRTGDTSIAATLVARAAALFAELAASQGVRRLLHGDLHHGNVLLDDRRGWLAIDPKGVVGEPAYECGAALRNPDVAPTLVASRAVAERRSHIMAERLGLDRRRVLDWAFAQAVLSAVWAREGGDRPDWALAAAAALQAAA